MNPILLEGFEYTAKSNLPFDEYRNCTFLITGATGLIGSLLIKNLLYCNQVYGLNVRILAVVRNLEKAAKIYKDEVDDQALIFIRQDFSLPMQEINESIDYIVHAAAITSSKDMVRHPVDNINVSVKGTMSVLELARQKCVKGMVYVSSMEVYGNLGNLDCMITEDMLGHIELTSPRSCYPEGKRLCECLCNAYAGQYRLNIKSARLAQTFGPGILESESRVFAQFAKSVMNRKDIVLHTDGASEGNYVYTADAVVGILLLLTKGDAGTAYNISNEDNHMTIRDMAVMVAEELAHNEIKIVYEIPENPMAYPPNAKMHLSSEKLRALGWEPQTGLKEMYQKMISYMKMEQMR